MNAIKHIRTNLFQCTQAEFAEFAKVRQSTVSRWEAGGAPTLAEMQAIREAAKARGIQWDDALFFDAPAAAE